MGKYYKVKHENVVGKSKIVLNNEELTELLDKHLELNGLNMDFETENDFYNWYENKNNDLLIEIENGLVLDCGDYDIIYA